LRSERGGTLPPHAPGNRKPQGCFLSDLTRFGWPRHNWRQRSASDRRHRFALALASEPAIVSAGHRSRKPLLNGLAKFPLRQPACIVCRQEGDCSQPVGGSRIALGFAVLCQKRSGPNHLPGPCVPCNCPSSCERKRRKVAASGTRAERGIVGADSERFGIDVIPVRCLVAGGVWNRRMLQINGKSKAAQVRPDPCRVTSDRRPVRRA
jgi:hypothetical protein